LVKLRLLLNIIIVFFCEDGSKYTKVRELPPQWLQLSASEVSTIQAAASAAKLKVLSSNTIPENHVLAFTTIAHCGSPISELIDWDRLYLFTSTATNFNSDKGVTNYLGFNHPLNVNSIGNVLLTSFNVGQGSCLHLVLKLRGD